MKNMVEAQSIFYIWHILGDLSSDIFFPYHTEVYGIHSGLIVVGPVVEVC